MRRRLWIAGLFSLAAPCGTWLTAHADPPNYLAEGRFTRSQGGVSGVSATIYCEINSQCSYDPCTADDQTMMRMAMLNGTDWDAPPGVWLQAGKAAAMVSPNSWWHFVYGAKDLSGTPVSQWLGSANVYDPNEYTLRYYTSGSCYTGVPAPCAILTVNNIYAWAEPEFCLVNFHRVLGGTQLLTDKNLDSSDLHDFNDQFTWNEWAETVGGHHQWNLYDGRPRAVEAPLDALFYHWAHWLIRVLQPQGPPGMRACL